MPKFYGEADVAEEAPANVPMIIGQLPSPKKKRTSPNKPLPPPPAREDVARAEEPKQPKRLKKKAAEKTYRRGAFVGTKKDFVKLGLGDPTKKVTKKRKAVAKKAPAKRRASVSVKLPVIKKRRRWNSKAYAESHKISVDEAKKIRAKQLRQRRRAKDIKARMVYRDVKKRGQLGSIRGYRPTKNELIEVDRQYLRPDGTRGVNRVVATGNQAIEWDKVKILGRRAANKRGEGYKTTKAIRALKLPKGTKRRKSTA